jgi:hypothetical protein
MEEVASEELSRLRAEPVSANTAEQLFCRDEQLEMKDERPASTLAELQHRSARVHSGTVAPIAASGSASMTAAFLLLIKMIYYRVYSSLWVAVITCIRVVLTAGGGTDTCSTAQRTNLSAASSSRQGSAVYS